jgi:hypothetical protein
MIDTHCAMIIKHLKEGKTLTSLEAFDLFGCTRLAARIHDLRCRGESIQKRMRKVVNRFGKNTAVAEYFKVSA